ncbi:MAG TPA: hypothetical protein VII18_14880 [Mycobacterium sp.]|jgi:hypothetical protein
MNGRESAVGTHWAYQVHGVTVNRNRRKLRCKKKELGIFRNILWRNLWAANRSGESPANLEASVRSRDTDDAKRSAGDLIEAGLN